MKNKISALKINRNYIFVIFFVLIVLYSLFIYKDFGVSLDEEIQYTHLKVSAKKIFSTLGILEKAPESVKEAQDIEEYENKYYGVSAQYPLIFLEYFPETHGPDTPNFWFVRHLYVRIAFIFAGVCFYLILKDIIKSNSLLLLGLILFFFHPRISAHSFYNIKDSLFLSFFTISTYYLFKCIKNRKITNLITFSILTAITINIRMMGILLPVYFGFWLLLNIKNNFKETLKTAVIFLIFTFLFLYIIWPALWGNPVNVLKEVFQTFSNYTGWDEYIVYAGEIIRGQELPVEYLPVWIAISSPLGYLLVFILGLFLTPFILFKLFKSKELGYKFHVLLFSLYTVLLSYGAIIFFNSTLYGDWRHLYYIYTSLVLMGVLGLDFLLEKNVKLFYVSVSFIVLSLFSSFVWMKKNHPHYYVYFNVFARKDWDYKWERDYWRLSTKQLLEEFIEINNIPNSDDKYIFRGSYGGELNSYLLPPEIRDKLIFTQQYDEAQYLIGTYTNVIGEYPENNFEGFEEYLSVKVDGKKIMTVFKKVENFEVN